MNPRLSASMPADGVARCARYAFGPNRLHLCGPDANREVLAYLNEGIADGGLTYLLTKFKTLYPYLETIAHANRIDDVFDPRVVEAYWLGNELLDTITPQTFYRHLTNNLQLKKHLTPKAINSLTDKLSASVSVSVSVGLRRPQAQMHHNFHVFNVWQRTGHVNENHTLESMDQCRVSWGVVTAVDGPFITVDRQPLVWSHHDPQLSFWSEAIESPKDPIGRPDLVGTPSRMTREKSGLTLAPPIQTKLTRRLEHNYPMEDVAPGDWISMHWGMPCEVLSSHQLKNLKRYTRLSLSLANLSL